jgi:hypothetical protein
MQSPNNPGNDASKTEQIEEQEKEEEGSSISILNNTASTYSKLTDKKIKNKGLNSMLNSQITIHKKIQLWTNRYQSEFALRLVDNATATDQSQQNFLAVTEPKADYIIVVAEIDYFGDLKHGWEYTLRHLLEQYKEELQAQSLGKISLNNNNDNDNRITIKLIPYIKCHYCDLEFNNEEEEKEHELGCHI